MSKSALPSTKDTIHFGHLHEKPDVGYLYYKLFCGKNDEWLNNQRNFHGGVERAKRLDIAYAAWLENKIKEYGYVVFITAGKQRDWLDAVIEQFNLGKHIHFRQEKPCFNAGYIDKPRLSTYVFKEHT